LETGCLYKKIVYGILEVRGAVKGLCIVPQDAITEKVRKVWNKKVSSYLDR
jgi:hypothetical protein